MTNESNSRPLLAALSLSGALVLSAGVLGLSFVQGRQPPGTVRVVGAATVPFVSDVVKWRVTLERHTALGGEVQGYRQLAQDRDRFLSALRGAGVADGDVSVQPVTTGGTWNRDGEQTGVDFRQSFLVVSGDVEAVEGLALDPGALVQNGLGLQGSSLEYLYEDMATLKRSLLRQAREDARARAEEIGGSGLGSLMEARAGVFQIREPYSTEVDGSGMYSTATRAKEMTVTVHAVYRLR